MTKTVRFPSWTRRRNRVTLLSLCAMGVFCMFWAAHGVVYTFTQCSKTGVMREVQDLCELYAHGEVAGDLCHTLCLENKFLFSECGGDNDGKHVAILRCPDCDTGKAVLKTNVDIHKWTRDRHTLLEGFETSDAMIRRSRSIVIDKFRTSFKTDLTNKVDLFSYIWRQKFYNFVYTGNRTISALNKRTSVALQSILSLSRQEEYNIMLNLNSTMYVPQLYGTCGPTYLVKYTPTFVESGYVQFDSQVFEALNFVRSPPVRWEERVIAALQLLNMLQHLESMEPPVFMCDIMPRNFGFDMHGNVVILDVDCLKFDQMRSPDTVCKSDSDCGFVTCQGRCNMTTNRCIKGPVSSHLEVACRHILVSFVPMFGLLRFPPSHVAEELQQLLMESCWPTNKSESLPWKSDLIIQQRLVTLLRLSVA